jgi:hypothetical protein
MGDGKERMAQITRTERKKRPTMVVIVMTSVAVADSGRKTFFAGILKKEERRKKKIKEIEEKKDSKQEGKTDCSSVIETGVDLFCGCGGKSWLALKHKNRKRQRITS